MTGDRLQAPTQRQVPRRTNIWCLAPALCFKMSRGAACACISPAGRTRIYMKQEADLLGITPMFDGGVYGAVDDYKSFSKGILIQAYSRRKLWLSKNP